jgi:hypothetical protein
MSQFRIDVSMKALVCPKCLSSDGLRLSRLRAYDILLRLIGLHPYRCHKCLTRFYSWKRLLPFAD